MVVLLLAGCQHQVTGRRAVALATQVESCGAPPPPPAPRRTWDDTPYLAEYLQLP